MIPYLRVTDHVLYGRQVTVDVENALRTEALSQGRLAGPPHSTQPCNGCLTPGVLNALEPERSRGHVTVLCVWNN